MAYDRALNSWLPSTTERGTRLVHGPHGADDLDLVRAAVHQVAHEDGGAPGMPVDTADDPVAQDVEQPVELVGGAVDVTDDVVGGHVARLLSWVVAAPVVPWSAHAGTVSGPTGASGPLVRSGASTVEAVPDDRGRTSPVRPGRVCAADASAPGGRRTPGATLARSPADLSGPEDRDQSDAAIRPASTLARRSPGGIAASAASCRPAS